MKLFQSRNYQLSISEVWFVEGNDAQTTINGNAMRMLHPNNPWGILHFALVNEVFPRQMLVHANASRLRPNRSWQDERSWSVREIYLAMCQLGSKRIMLWRAPAWHLTNYESPTFSTSWLLHIPAMNPCALVKSGNHLMWGKPWQRQQPKMSASKVMQR